MAIRNPSPFDVVVVGGGPAGSAAAITAAQAGMRVILLEETSGAHHKVCGEFLSVETQVLLARLGVDLDRLGAPSQSRLRLVNRGQTAGAELPFKGRSLSRYVLDEYLLKNAARSGVLVERASKATSFSCSDGTGLSTITISGGSKSISAKRDSRDRLFNRARSECARTGESGRIQDGSVSQQDCNARSE